LLIHAVTTQCPIGNGCRLTRFLVSDNEHREQFAMYITQIQSSEHVQVQNERADMGPTVQIGEERRAACETH